MNAKTKLFCQHYITHFNGALAARETGYSDNTSHIQANRLLSRDDVQSYIQELMSSRMKRVEISADDVLRELIKIAFHDIRKLYNENGQLKPMSEIDDETAAVISSFKTRIEKTGKGKDDFDIIEEFKRYDKVKTLELIGRHLGMFEKSATNPQSGAKSQRKRVIIAKRSER